MAASRSSEPVDPSGAHREMSALSAATSGSPTRRPSWLTSRVVGTLTGFVVGLVICLNIESIREFLSWLTSTELFSPELYFLSKLPAEIDIRETSAVVIMALTLSFLATLYPSWRAARLDPVEALRYE